MQTLTNTSLQIQSRYQLNIIGEQENSTLREQCCPLTHWQASSETKSGKVLVAAGDDFSPLFDHLNTLSHIVVEFPVFTDGRGFSTARELRERGYSGTLVAAGNFIVDQIDYLARCGFDTFEFNSETLAEIARGKLNATQEVYQGDALQPLPLFRRRSTTGVM
jgi:uncharacterized protein (DUF934 family)